MSSRNLACAQEGSGSYRDLLTPRTRAELAGREQLSPRRRAELQLAAEVCAEWGWTVPLVSREANDPHCRLGKANREPPA